MNEFSFRVKFILWGLAEHCNTVFLWSFKNFCGLQIIFVFFSVDSVCPGRFFFEQNLNSRY